MSPRHDRTLQAIFEDPVRANITWVDVETMMTFLGGTVRQRAGSRVAINLNGVALNVHRPHSKECHRYQIRIFRDFLQEAGVAPQ